jgi:hypothetical protein
MGSFVCVQATPTEIANIVGGFEDNSTLPQHGLFLGGTKYMVIQGDPGVVIRGKKVICHLFWSTVYFCGNFLWTQSKTIFLDLKMQADHIGNLFL